MTVIRTRRSGDSLRGGLDQKGIKNGTVSFLVAWAAYHDKENPFELPTVTPYLVVEGVRELMDFLAKVFDAHPRCAPKIRELRLGPACGDENRGHHRDDGRTKGEFSPDAGVVIRVCRRL